MGARGGRAREGGLEGSREAHAGVEEGGKGTCSCLILLSRENYDMNILAGNLITNTPLPF